jgi:hypothetical protein
MGDHADVSTDDWAAVLSGTADEETLARYRRAREDENSSISQFVRQLAGNNRSLLGLAIMASKPISEEERDKVR